MDDGAESNILGWPSQRAGGWLNEVTLTVDGDDFEVAEATYRAAVARWPAARITLRQGADRAGKRAAKARRRPPL